jgi:hypothetical protein
MLHNPDHVRTDDQRTDVGVAADHRTHDTQTRFVGGRNKKLVHVSGDAQPMHDEPVASHYLADAQDTAGGDHPLKRGQVIGETHAHNAASAADHVGHDTQSAIVGGAQIPDHGRTEIQVADVGTGGAGDQTCHDNQCRRVAGPFDAVCDAVKMMARRRKYAMKVQQKIDRQLESFIRENYTAWTPVMPEEEREKYNDEVRALIKEAEALIKKPEAGRGDPGLLRIVDKTNLSREVWDLERKDHERDMVEIAKGLPVAGWIDSIPGVGLLGLAIIIGETGPLDRYANPAKVWKRLGYAPYDGHAGSTWKRDKWRPRTLTKEEWIANPFSGRRYADMTQIAKSLYFKQWIGKEKDPDHKGKPNGPYGEVYGARKAKTLLLHPEWYNDAKGKQKRDKHGNATSAHAEKDAHRVMMKEFLKDLWCEWKRHIR